MAEAALSMKHEIQQLEAGISELLDLTDGDGLHTLALEMHAQLKVLAFKIALLQKGAQAMPTHVPVL